MTDILRLIHTTGDRWQCEQSGSTGVKVNEGARLGDVAFYDKSGVRQKQTLISLNVDEMMTIVSPIGRKFGFPCVFPSPQGNQVGR